MTLLYLIIVNIFGFLIIYIDKKRAKRNKWRIPEKTLFLVATFGGSIGTILGMYIFRHKTQKIKFKFGVPVIIAIQIICVTLMTGPLKQEILRSFK